MKKENTNMTKEQHKYEQRKGKLKKYKGSSRGDCREATSTEKRVGRSMKCVFLLFSIFCNN